ncbi:MAG: hypothetical protein O3A49_06190 [Candidatus Marinimicrobia bacterium]|nr:hypothetical protein [Candidatus Neomarinimicrobiota bacterium]
MNLKKTGLNGYLAILFLYLMFGRSFSGVAIFGYRVGELLIAANLLFSFIFFPYGYLSKYQKFFIFDKKIFLITKVFLFSFLISLFTTGGSLINTYTYRSSSIIWSVNFIFFGYFVFNNINDESWFFKALPLVPILLYIFSTLLFPQVLINFFNTYSDKFDFVKGSDLLLAYIVAMLFARNKLDKTYSGFAYFLFISALYVPLFLYKSKGAFFPAILFIICNVFFYGKFISKNKLKAFSILIISVPIFLASTFNSYGNLTFKKAGMDGVSQSENLLQAVPDAFSVILNQKNTSAIFASFFIYDGRLYSQEQMANWRLQIWQDVARDLFWYANYYQDPKNYQLVREQLDRRNDVFLTGFGYNEILPAMNHWERNGNDGSNQNPHNFFVYALGRGGLFLALLVIIFHTLTISYWYKKYKNFQILYFVLPVLFGAFFDAAMESVRYPLIYYSFYGYFAKNGIKN